MGVGNAVFFQKTFFGEERYNGPGVAKHRTSLGESTDVMHRKYGCLHQRSPMFLFSDKVESMEYGYCWFSRGEWVWCVAFESLTTTHGVNAFGNTRPCGCPFLYVDLRSACSWYSHDNLDHIGYLANIGFCRYFMVFQEFRPLVKIVSLIVSKGRCSMLW